MSEHEHDDIPLSELPQRYIYAVYPHPIALPFSDGTASFLVAIRAFVCDDQCEGDVTVTDHPNEASSLIFSTPTEVKDLIGTLMAGAIDVWGVEAMAPNVARLATMPPHTEN